MIKVIMDHIKSELWNTLYIAVIIVLILPIIYIYVQLVLYTIKHQSYTNIRYSLPRNKPLRKISAKNLLREKTFDEYCKEVDDLIERAIELEDFGKKGRLSEACAYALRGGKRLRPIITLEIVRATTLIHQDILVDPADAVLFIEYLHTASLVIDDLPAFDNDNDRRGKATVHIKTDPATAQMVALSLVSAALQNITRQIDWIRDNCPKFKNVDYIGTCLCFDVGQTIGPLGAAGGQFMDSVLSSDELFSQYGETAIIKMIQLKTATFFELSFLTGWLIAGGSAEESIDIRHAGRHFGIAFQIADDINDMTQDSERQALGKSGWNFANEYGLEVAIYFITQNLNMCRLFLEEKKLYTPLWKEIYRKVWAITGL